MNETYQLSEATVREYCEFWTHPQESVAPLNQPSSYIESLRRQVCNQHGILLHYMEDDRGFGVAVAAFASGIRIFKTRGRGPYEATSTLSWETLELTKTHLK